MTGDWQQRTTWAALGTIVGFVSGVGLLVFWAMWPERGTW